IDDLKIELGYALLPLVNGPDGSDRLTEQIKALRRSLAIEMGFVMPAVRILDNVQLEANTYVIKIKEVDAGTGKIWPNQFMVMDPVPSQVTISGIQRVLQLLLAERISIRDLSTILEGIADALAFSRNPATMVEHVRARLARQICAQNTSQSGYLPLIALSARW